FGVVLENVGQLQKDADKATKLQTDDQAKLATAQQALTDLQARLAAATQAAQDKAAQAVQSAQDKVSAALEHQTQAADRVTQAQDKLAAAGQSVVNAQQAVTDATQKVADAQTTLTDALSEETKLRAQQSATNNLADANLALRQSQFDAADAADKLKTMQASGTATATDLAKQQLAVDSANQRLVESQQRVKDMQDAANVAAKVGTDQDPAVIAAKKGVAAATDSLTKAQQGAVTASQNQQQAVYNLSQ